MQIIGSEAYLQNTLNSWNEISGNQLWAVSGHEIVRINRSERNSKTHTHLHQIFSGMHDTLSLCLKDNQQISNTTRQNVAKLKLNINYRYLLYKEERSYLRALWDKITQIFFKKISVKHTYRKLLEEVDRIYEIDLSPAEAPSEFLRVRRPFRESDTTCQLTATDSAPSPKKEKQVDEVLGPEFPTNEEEKLRLNLRFEDIEVTEELQPKMKLLTDFFVALDCSEDITHFHFTKNPSQAYSRFFSVDAFKGFAGEASYRYHILHLGGNEGENSGEISLENNKLAVIVRSSLENINFYKKEDEDSDFDTNEYRKMRLKEEKFISYHSFSDLPLNSFEEELYLEDTIRRIADWLNYNERELTVQINSAEWSPYFSKRLKRFASTQKGIKLEIYES